MIHQPLMILKFLKKIPMKKLWEIFVPLQLFKQNIFQLLTPIYIHDSYWFMAGLQQNNTFYLFYPFLLYVVIFQRSAQLKLQESLVVILDTGTPLCDEIVKNLAMAGVGKLTILKDSSLSRRNSWISLRSNESLANYAKSLNPLMQVWKVSPM